MKIRFEMKSFPKRTHTFNSGSFQQPDQAREVMEYLGTIFNDQSGCHLFERMIICYGGKLRILF